MKKRWDDEELTLTAEIMELANKQGLPVPELSLGGTIFFRDSLMKNGCGSKGGMQHGHNESGGAKAWKELNSHKTTYRG